MTIDNYTKFAYDSNLIQLNNSDVISVSLMVDKNCIENHNHTGYLKPAHILITAEHPLNLKEIEDIFDETITSQYGKTLTTHTRKLITDKSTVKSALSLYHYESYRAPKISSDTVDVYYVYSSIKNQ